MRLLASVPVRIFLICWIVFTVHFATNVVREHYPAFALIERGNFQCDEYWDEETETFLHADIFWHDDGHAYVGNNVLGAVIAVPPLLLFDPLLDWLQRRQLARLEASDEPPEATYDTPHPIRRRMFAAVKRKGLDLRFGASTAITSAFVMAPLSALLVVLLYRTLLGRGVPRGRATWLALLFAFGTPVFYRTAHLNHNMFLMEAVFAAALLLWVRPEESFPLSRARRLGAGALAGAAFALDYAGAVPCAVLYAYLVLARVPSGGWWRALKESAPFVLASLPGLVFLLLTQWWMYGDPFTPGQFVMPPVNYTEEGVKGISWPSLEVFVKNLFSPGWGLFTFGPLLLVALLPLRGAREELRLVPRRERLFFGALVLTFMLFCAANVYSLMQFNTGFRYLLPVVPFLYLAACEPMARWSRPTLAVVSALAVFHTWVLTTARVVRDTEKNLRDLAVARGVPEWSLPDYWSTLLSETAVPLSYRVLLEEGPQLPWLAVLRRTSGGEGGLLHGPLLPLAILALTGLAVAAVWWLGARQEAAAPPAAPGASRPVLPARPARGT